jgi:hypothetical protein
MEDYQHAFAAAFRRLKATPEERHPTSGFTRAAPALQCRLHGITVSSATLLRYWCSLTLMPASLCYVCWHQQRTCTRPQHHLTKSVPLQKPSAPCPFTIPEASQFQKLLSVFSQSLLQW